MSTSTLVYAVGPDVRFAANRPTCTGRCVFGRYGTPDADKCIMCGFVREVLFETERHERRGYGICTGCDNSSHKCGCYYLSDSSGMAEMCATCGIVPEKGELVVFAPYESNYYDSYETHIKCWFDV